MAAVVVSDVHTSVLFVQVPLDQLSVMHRRSRAEATTPFNSFHVKVTVKLDNPSALENCFELQVFMVGASVLSKLNSTLGGEAANLAQVLAPRTPFFNLSAKEA